VIFRSRSGLFVGVFANFVAAAFFAANSFRFFGDTAPVVAVPRGALRPIFGRVLACRCFLPNRFFSFFGAMVDLPRLYHGRTHSPANREGNEHRRRSSPVLTSKYG
jgi:hypothetical protein